MSAPTGDGGHMTNPRHPYASLLPAKIDAIMIDSRHGHDEKRIRDAVRTVFGE